MESIVEGNEVLLFYGWWQLSVCTFAFLALLAIWWHIGKIRKDHGQVFLAASILCWSLSGLVEIYFASISQTNLIIHEGLRSVLSLFNSLFILLALPWFKYLPKRLNTIIKSKYWNYIIGLPFIFSLLPTLSKMWTGESNSTISELDVYFAFLTLGFLATVLWTSFQKRRLPQLAYLSLICIGITIVAQIYKLTDADINLTLFSAIFKTTLIMLFFALALSWVKELTENVIPNSNRLTLKLFINKESPSKLRRFAQINGIPGLDSEPISLSPSNYDLLLRFAKSRVETEDGWLEIKPKEANLRVDYDINDHNELKRLLKALLDGIFGSSAWTKEQHYVPLKESLFELSQKRERKIRLKLLPKNISF